MAGTRIRSRDRDPWNDLHPLEATETKVTEESDYPMSFKLTNSRGGPSANGQCSDDQLSSTAKGAFICSKQAGGLECMEAAADAPRDRVPCGSQLR
jgi:hypothetical protein